MDQKHDKNKKKKKKKEKRKEKKPRSGTIKGAKAPTKRHSTKKQLIHDKR